MAATMTSMLRLADITMPLGNDAMPPCKNLTPFGARSVITTLCPGNNANLGNVATPLGARSVTTTPRLGNSNRPLGNNVMPLGNNPTMLGALCNNNATLKKR